VVQKTAITKAKLSSLYLPVADRFQKKIKKMRILLVVALLFQFQNMTAQVLLDADGPGNTYGLINSVLAPGYDVIEAPDCSHPAFGDHIDEVFDSILNTNVFRFFIHTTPDDDRCINFDRQRNEIKAYDKSPENLLGKVGEVVVYKWKFKLAAGFQSSSNFTHIHQLKSVGGSLASMPMYTLTVRKSSPDRLELRYAETNSQITLKQTDLAPLLDTWLEVTETVKYGISGTYDIEIKQVSDSAVLFAHSESSIINWRTGGDFVRPKWGIYRSLVNVQDLRDEEVLFANFSIDEIISSSISDAEKVEDLKIIPSPAKNTIVLENITEKAELVQIFSLDGKKIFEKTIQSTPQMTLDVSSFSNGTYIVRIIGKEVNQSKMMLIAR
jgi:hypothetical protein